MKQSFDVVVEKDKGTGQYFGSVPALPGCYSQGSTLEELLDNMKEAISLHLESLDKKDERNFESVVGMVKVVV